MNPNEHSSLQEFLGRFTAPTDPSRAQATSPNPVQASGSDRAQWLQHWAHAHPEALERVLVHAQGLAVELEAAQRSAERAERARRMGVPVQPAEEDLRRQSQAWGLLLGTGGGGRQQAVATAGAVPRGRRTFEDVGARFFAENVGKIWAVLAVLSLVVVLVREGIV